MSLLHCVWKGHGELPGVSSLSPSMTQGYGNVRILPAAVQAPSFQLSAQLFQLPYLWHTSQLQLLGPIVPVNLFVLVGVRVPIFSLDNTSALVISHPSPTVPGWHLSLVGMYFCTTNIDNPWLSH